MFDDSSITEAQHTSQVDTLATQAALTETQVHQVIWREHSPHQEEVPTQGFIHSTRYLAFKLALEYAIALVLFVLSVPVILVTALLVKLTSRGPGFYSQLRLGKNSRPFMLYKIRTMTHNCEKISGPRWATPDDPRITLVGSFLRRTHLDELPQLWNVLRGEMSLVGPRPERPEFIPALEQALPHYRDRLQVRPGVTGLAQVQQGPDSDLESVRRKLAYDLYYIRHMNLWLDLRLVVCTGVRMLGVSFHMLGRFFYLPRPGVVENHYRAREVQAAQAAPALCLEPLS
jgi:lipopolysaccharide/colanic/teichoic acid biosynthesis glycosyltransferase